jgi:hypothetical protein
MNNNCIKKIVAVFSLLVMASAFTSCNESEGEYTLDSNSYYQIVVDEETLVQYIKWNSRPDYPSDARIGGMTVRVKEDGTPYTIAREDLDKYTHFRFKNTENEEQE